MTIQESVYGPMHQTLAFGLSIIDFSCALGWNDSGSSLTINLVRDPCGASADSPKKYYDQTTLAELTTTAPDPGFTYPTPGSFYYFRFGDFFDYSGIVQAYTTQYSENGNPTYTVTLSDPREILAGVQVILGGYEGSVNGVPNLFNVFGFAETYGSSCPACFGGGFGGSGNTFRGMLWNVVKNCISIMTSTLGGIASPFGLGRIFFRNESYLLDISEVPYVANYRFQAGSAISLLDAISEICESIGLDYYVELVPAIYNNTLYKIIKVRTANRRAQPNLNQIAKFINQGVGSNNSSNGLELRNEIVQSVLVGGAKQRMYNVFMENLGTPYATIAPYWGLDVFGNAIVGQDVGDDHNFNLDLSYLGISGLNDYNVTVAELRCALSGYDTWLTYLGYNHPEAARSVGLDENNTPLSFDIIVDAIKNKKDIFPAFTWNLKQASLDLANEWMSEPEGIRKIDLLWQVINSYATQFYGRKFMVSMPNLCATYDIESQNVIFSEDISDAGWVDLEDTTLGIVNPANLDLFRNEDGRVGCFVRFDVPIDELDISQLDGNNAFVDEGLLYLRVDVDGDYVFTDTTDLTTLKAVIDLGEPIRQRQFERDTTPHFFRFILEQSERIANKAGVTKSQVEQYLDRFIKTLGSGLLQFVSDYPVYIPTGAAIPLQSNIEVYGPWSVTSLAIGKIHYEQDSSLVPWNFGDTVTLNSVATSLANDYVTSMQIGEMGNIEVPGAPVLRLGDEIQSGAAGLNALRATILDCAPVDASSTIKSGNSRQNNTPTPDNVTTQTLGFPTVPWTGAYGPNITGIDVRIGPDGVRTTYRMRTFTPSFGTLSKQYQEKVRRIGQNTNKLIRLQRRFFRTPQPKLLGLENRGQTFVGQNGPVGTVNRSPHSVLLGQVLPSGSGYSTTSYVQTQHVGESKTELTDIDKKHMISFDALLRPFKTGGSGSGCPIMNLEADSGRYAMPNIPPRSGDGFEDMPITALTLNPYLNSSDDSPLYPFENITSGHDIGYVGYNSGVYNQTLRNYPSGDSQYYQPIALKGPLIMAGWGFDISGKPVPNADPENPEDKFEKNWLNKYEKWKVGPIDLRWDEARGVWCGDPGFRLMEVQFTTGCLALGTGNASFVDDPDTYDQDGLLVDNSFDVVNKYNINMASGQKSIVYYNTPSKEYWAITNAGSRVARGKLLGTLFAGSSTSGHIWTTSGSTDIDTNETIIIFDWLMKAGVSLPSGTKIIAFQESATKWILQEASCP